MWTVKQPNRAHYNGAYVFFEDGVPKLELFRIYDTVGEGEIDAISQTVLAALNQPRQLPIARIFTTEIDAL